MIVEKKRLSKCSVRKRPFNGSPESDNDDNRKVLDKKQFGLLIKTMLTQGNFSGFQALKLFLTCSYLLSLHDIKSPFERFQYLSLFELRGPFKVFQSARQKDNIRSGVHFLSSRVAFMKI